MIHCIRKCKTGENAAPKVKSCVALRMNASRVCVCVCVYVSVYVCGVGLLGRVAGARLGLEIGSEQPEAGGGGYGWKASLCIQRNAKAGWECSFGLER